VSKRFIQWEEDIVINMECNKCHNILSSSMFTKNSSQLSKLNPQCKNCISQKSKDYYKANSDKIKSYVNEYCVKNKDLVLKKKREYHKKTFPLKAKNKQFMEKRRVQAKHWRAKNIDHVQFYNKKYKTNNKELCNKIARRRVSSKRTTCLKLNSQLKNQLSEYSLIVKELNKLAGFRKYHVDHIIPLSHPNVCGLHTPANLQILLNEENCSKSNKFDGTYENESWRKDL
jgi:hypothetical protein